jgi:hypothetical protein
MNQLPYPGDSVSSASDVAATRLGSGPYPREEEKRATNL